VLIPIGMMRSHNVFPIGVGWIPTRPFVHKFRWCSIDLIAIDILPVSTGGMLSKSKLVRQELIL
jgi:hypothetical protein